MWVLLLEALGALVIFVVIVWWTMFHKSAAQKKLDALRRDDQSTVWGRARRNSSTGTSKRSPSSATQKYSPRMLP